MRNKTLMKRGLFYGYDLIIFFLKGYGCWYLGQKIPGKNCFF
jgi:hypothetical protein